MARGPRDQFHRLYGDADGDRDVDATDQPAFQAALGQTDPAALSTFDFNRDALLGRDRPDAVQPPAGADDLMPQPTAVRPWAFPYDPSHFPISPHAARRAGQFREPGSSTGEFTADEG